MKLVRTQSKFVEIYRLEFVILRQDILVVFFSMN